MILTHDCWHHIFELLDGDIVSQQKIKSLCEKSNTLPITDLFNIDYKHKKKLNDKILLKFKHVEYLCVVDNKK